MEDDARATETKYHDAVFTELMSECKNNAPNARFSNNLRQKLERMRPSERRALVSRTRDSCAPLLVAARRGNAEAVEYLVHVCDAQLEQRGVYQVPEDRSRHSVTALWCAAVAGRAEALRVLMEAGADVDAASDTGSTPVRSACFMTHVETVRLLLRGGADVHRANHSGGTCLINAVQSARLCALLLDASVAVDARDVQGKTALHYAAQEHRMETARLLLQHGADAMLRSAAGDDVLQVACIKGAVHVRSSLRNLDVSIMKMLLARGSYSLSRAADAYELLGATQLDEFNDVAAALASWRRATMLRHSVAEYVEKQFVDDEGVQGAQGAWLRAGVQAALGGTQEWRSLRSLEMVAGDMDQLRAQALLVAARVLGAAHKDTVFRFMYRGAAYADAFRYQRCIDLWLWALEVRIAKDTILCPETNHAALALTRLLLDAEGGRLERAHDLPRFGDAARVLELLTAAVLHARRLLRPQPRCLPQVECNEDALRCLAHVAHVALRAARGAAARRRVARAARAALGADVRGAAGASLLHLSVARLDLVASSYFGDEPGAQAAPVFPSEHVTRLLLRCGADPAALDDARCTPLHVAALPHNFRNELVELLLEAGAHLDQPNAFGESALEALEANPESRVRPLRYVTLACLCARALAARPPPPAALLPRALRPLLRQHRPARNTSKPPEGAPPAPHAPHAPRPPRAQP